MIWIINHTTDQVYKTIQERHHLVLQMSHSGVIASRMDVETLRHGEAK